MGDPKRNTRKAAHPPVKYKARINDLDKFNVRGQGFIEGRPCASCLMYLTGRMGQVECLTEVIRSQWSEPFGDSRHCEHPDMMKFVDLANTVLARFDERQSRRAPSP